MPKPIHLALVEADKIHSYVFAAPQLRLIRGASIRHARACSKLWPRLLRQSRFPGDTPVIAAGGRFMALLPDAGGAESMARLAAEWIWRFTGEATATWASGSGSSFRAARKEAQDRIEIRKRARRGAAGALSTPYWLRCETCGLHEARGFKDIPQTRALCAACLRRFRASQRRSLLAQCGIQDRDLAKDLQGLSELAAPKNYLAMIYLDVDRAGKWFDDRSSSDRELAAASTGLAKAIAAGVSAGCEAVCAAIPEGVAPVEPLILGGDDAVVILPAGLAESFLRALEKGYSESNLADKPSYSVGMAIVHSHYPIAQTFRMCEELLREAKTIPSEHSIDFHIVPGSLAGSILDLRQAAPLGTTQKPIALSSFFGWCDAIRELKSNGFPKSKLEALYRISFMGYEQSMLEGLYLRSALSEAHQDSLGKEDLFPRFRTDGIWQPDANGVRTTKAADLAELWPFVAAR